MVSQTVNLGFPLLIHCNFNRMFHLTFSASPNRWRACVQNLKACFAPRSAAFVLLVLDLVQFFPRSILEIGKIDCSEKIIGPHFSHNHFAYLFFFNLINAIMGELVRELFAEFKLCRIQFQKVFHNTLYVDFHECKDKSKHMMLPTVFLPRLFET